MSTMIKTYSDMLDFNVFEERLGYLRIGGVVGKTTFNGHRILNQILYQSKAWKKTREKVIIRDNGCDLGISDRPIYDVIYIHHINPITIDDILERRSIVFDLENLVCTSRRTHDRIHYGSEELIIETVTERKRYDTCPWRN